MSNTVDSKLCTWEHDKLFTIMHGLPKFVYVFRLVKPRGKAKKGDLLVMPKLHQFFTLRQWQDSSDADGMEINAEDTTLVEFMGYYQYSGVMLSDYLTKSGELPHINDLLRDWRHS